VCSILGVDLDERVPVLDMDAMDNWLRGMTNQQAAAFIAQLAHQSPILTLDASANVGISSRPYGKRHVVRNKATDRRKNLVVTGKVLSNMEDFIKSSVVIEIAPNRKAGRNLSGMSDGQKRAQHHKNTVNAYYYIMLPVKHNNQLNTLVLIAEERNGCLIGETAQVELYQIQYANKERDPALMPTQHRVSINTRQHAPTTVSIREMLAGVKTSDGNFYYQQAWHGAAKNQQKEEPQMAQNPRERVSRVIRSHGRSLYIHCIKRHPKSKAGRRLRANEKHYR